MRHDSLAVAWHGTIAFIPAAVWPENMPLISSVGLIQVRSSVENPCSPSGPSTPMEPSHSASSNGALA
jgi:hypothetical protein